MLFIVNLIVVTSAFYILPNRFFYDASDIALEKGNEIGFLGSYLPTILFYKVTGLRYLPFPLIALIQYLILIYTLFKIVLLGNFDKINVKNILVYLGFL
jgi:hypothetical protein